MDGRADENGWLGTWHLGKEPPGDKRLVNGIKLRHKNNAKNGERCRPRRFIPRCMHEASCVG